ncbi:MAG: histidine kinase, partial [Solirubrobacteraceae bacterium]
MHTDAAGRTVEPQADADRTITPITRGGAPLGVVVHDGALAQRPTLLDPVLQAAGRAIEIARLRVELRRQLAEVEASRMRIVAASYEERRRIERDLHDGAQQRLVAVGLALRHLQHELPPSANGVGAGIDDAVTQVGQAVSDLRELARGVRPTRL